MTTSKEFRPATPDPSPPKRVALQYPANWDTLTDEQKMAVSRGIATELQRALGPKKAGVPAEATEQQGAPSPKDVSDR